MPLNFNLAGNFVIIFRKEGAVRNPLRSNRLSELVAWNPAQYFIKIDSLNKLMRIITFQNQRPLNSSSATKIIFLYNAQMRMTVSTLGNARQKVSSNAKQTRKL